MTRDRLSVAAGVSILAGVGTVAWLVFTSGDGAYNAPSAPDELTGFHYEAVFYLEDTLPEFREASTRVEVWRRLPDRSLTLTYKGDSDELDTLSLRNGDAVLSYDPDNNEYYEIIQPQPEHRPTAGTPRLGPLPAADLEAYFEAVEASTEASLYIEYADTEDIAGVEARVIHVICCRDEGFDQVLGTKRYWIDEDLMFLLAFEDENATGKIGARVETIEYNPKFAPERFDFQPPPGATPVEPD